MTTPRSRHNIGFATAALLVSLITGWAFAVQQDDPSGLESIFAAGPVLQDRNGDGHIDFVNAHVVLADLPTDAEVAAAANVAARLGFETSSMNLPITGASDGVPIVVGPSALARAQVTRENLGVDLEPGEGVVAWIDGTVGPTVAVVGGDDAGTLAAATTLGARVPHIWDPDGPTYNDVIDNAKRVLEAADIEEVTARIVRFIVEDGETGLQRLDLELTVRPGELSPAEAALRLAAEQPTDEPEQDTTVTEEGETAPPTLRFDGLRLLRIYLSDGNTEPSIVHVTGPEEMPSEATGSRPGPGNKSNLDLSNLYTNAGFFGDSDDNWIPDRVDVVLSAAGDVTGATVDLAARIGLEATGVAIPIALPPDAIDDPEQQPTLILIGQSHPLVERLVEEDKLSIPELESGQGMIRVVDDAFGEKRALVVVGADAAGLERAVRQVAERFPHLWERGKDRVTVADVKHDVWMAVASRSPVGQAATAVYKLDKMLEKLVDKDLERVDVGVHLEKADPGMTEYVRQRVANAITTDQLAVTVGNIDVQDGELLIDEEFEVASEVDEFWDILRADVVPRVSSGAGVSIEALLSEPPEVRDRIEQEAKDVLVAAGADPVTTSVTVLSAYKQGYSWLHDVVTPALHGERFDSIEIRFAEIGAPEGWPQQAMYTPTRWLLEIFPIDEVMAPALGIDVGQIRFQKMPVGSAAYEVIVTRGGREVYRESFEPKWVLRPYFDRFPDYEMARVTTGWITATVGDASVVDRRIVTDLERFWDHFQSHTLTQIYDYVMRIGEGKPSAADAPHFGELRIEVSLSEPEYKIGVDNEQVASMEALHEEIYFTTLHFFDVLGRFARGQALNYPGRVIPIVRPKSDGKPGHAKITFTGFGAARPMVTLIYKEEGEFEEKIQRNIPPVALDQPDPLGALVQDGHDGIERLDFRVNVDFEKDRRDEFIRRTSAQNLDARITSAEQITSVLANIGALREAGLYESHLAYPGFAGIELSAFWGHEFDPDSQVVVDIPGNGVPKAYADIAGGRSAASEWNGGEIVQWDTPIPPPEAYEILAKMSTFAEATTYKVGESYLGKQIWAMDLMAPVEGAYWSQAKASALKPTVIYSARQHANEVSSTSHVLKLAEQLLTDDEYENVLDKVNVVIHPITNPDGAQLAYDLYQITPDHMLHAGYLGALGVDATSGGGSDDPIYPESKVRPKLWNTWLPDIFLNPHGYPSHEWVQIFSEYAGWVRNRATQSRGWWGMRGWFMPGFRYVDDPDFPDHKDAAFEIRDRITEKINALPEIKALNERAYDRYRRYAFEWDIDNFKMDFTNDVLIYTSVTGSSGGGSGMNNPHVTIWSGTTEAPDETAYGDWMKLVASAGLAWDKALLEYLLEGDHEIERTENEFEGGVSFKIHRPRPPKREEDGEDNN